MTDGNDAPRGGTTAKPQQPKPAAVASWDLHLDASMRVAALLESLQFELGDIPQAAHLVAKVLELERAIAEANSAANETVRLLAGAARRGGHGG